MATSQFAYPVGVPFFQAFDDNGDPLSGGKLYTYAAGTSTPLATYPTYADALAGTNANANPVVLDAYGRAQVFVQVAFMKFILKNSADVTQANGTQDYVGLAYGVTPLSDPEWVKESSGAIAYVSAGAFTVAGVDVTGIYHTGRRVKTTNTGGTVYGTVTTSSFGTNTQVNISVDGATTLDSGLSAVWYGFNSYANPSYLAPRTAFSVVKNGNQTGFAASSKVTTWTVENDPLSEWDAANNRWKPKYSRGRYLIIVSAEYADTGTNVAVTLQIDKTAAVVAQSVTRSSPTANQIWSVTAHYVWAASSSTDYIEVFALGSANTTIQGTIGTRFTVVAIP